MGDDPYLPSVTGEAVSHGNGSAATGGMVNNIYSGLSRGGSLFVVVASCLAIGLAVGAVVITAMGGRDAARAERETRMLEYYVMELDGKLMAEGLIDYNESWAARKKAKETSK